MRVVHFYSVLVFILYLRNRLSEDIVTLANERKYGRLSNTYFRALRVVSTEIFWPDEQNKLSINQIRPFFKDFVKSHILPIRPGRLADCLLRVTNCFVCKNFIIEGSWRTGSWCLSHTWKEKKDGFWLHCNCGIMLYGCSSTRRKTSLVRLYSPFYANREYAYNIFLLWIYINSLPL